MSTWKIVEASKKILLISTIFQVLTKIKVLFDQSAVYVFDQSARGLKMRLMNIYQMPFDGSSFRRICPFRWQRAKQIRRSRLLIFSSLENIEHGFESPRLRILNWIVNRPLFGITHLTQMLSLPECPEAAGQPGSRRLEEGPGEVQEVRWGEREDVGHRQRGQNHRRAVSRSILPGLLKTLGVLDPTNKPQGRFLNNLKCWD